MTLRSSLGSQSDQGARRRRKLGSVRTNCQLAFCLSSSDPELPRTGRGFGGPARLHDNNIFVAGRVLIPCQGSGRRPSSLTAFYYVQPAVDAALCWVRGSAPHGINAGVALLSRSPERLPTRGEHSAQQERRAPNPRVHTRRECSNGVCWRSQAGKKRESTRVCATGRTHQLLKGPEGSNAHPPVAQLGGIGHSPSWCQRSGGEAGSRHAKARSDP